MSLINDALKHAKQTQQQYPPPTPPLHFRPVEPEPPSSIRGPFLFVGLALVLVLVVALGGLFAWFASPNANSELHVSARTAGQAAPTAVVASSPVPILSPAAVVAPVAAPGGTVTNASPATAVVEAALPPPMKIQGIAFRQARPSAIVNDKTVMIGDRVGEFRVLAITRNSVTLGGAAATNVLSLSE